MHPSIILNLVIHHQNRHATVALPVVSAKHIPSVLMMCWGYVTALSCSAQEKEESARWKDRWWEGRKVLIPTWHMDRAHTYLWQRRAAYHDPFFCGDPLICAHGTQTEMPFFFFFSNYFVSCNRRNQSLLGARVFEVGWKGAVSRRLDGHAVNKG